MTELPLEPLENTAGSEPAVCDVHGRLWRVRSRPSAAADLALAVIVLLVGAAIGLALVLPS